MTNEEAMNILYDSLGGRQEGFKEAFDIAINSILENTKLKAEIEEYNKTLTTWNNANNEMLKFNQELKDEIELLKAENEKLKEYIENQKKLYEYRIDLQLKYNDRNHEEIESLKSELGQSVKLPASIGDSVYVLAECQSISPILDGTLYDSSGGFGTATGYYCPYEDNCPHIDSDCDCEQLQSKTAIFEDEINGFIVESSGNILVSTQYCGLCGNINEYIFLTREEAKQSLKGED